MTELNVEALKKHIRILPDPEAAEYLESTLRQAVARNEFYAGNNVHLILPVLVLLGLRDLDRAGAVLAFLYRKHDRPYVAWIREGIHRDVRMIQRRRVLEASTREERQAQLVLASLMPGGKPPDDAEQGALVMARIRDDPAHACVLAVQWWNGHHVFDEFMKELFETCWSEYPHDFRAVLMGWKGAVREELIKSWMERLLPEYDARSANQIIRLLEVMQGSSYIDRELLFKVLNTLEGWTEDHRCAALCAMMPLWVRVFPHLYRDRDIDAVDVFLRLWGYDSSSESRVRLDQLLTSRDSQDRLKDARRIKRALKSHGEIGVDFGTMVHATAILCRRGKKLHDYLNRKYIRPDHRRLWRSFLRGEHLIQSIPDEMLRERLLTEHAAIAKETRRARKGAVLIALETETDAPIQVTPKRVK